MAEETDRTEDLGDARSRFENSRFRELVERSKGSNPEYAYAPRWVPQGNWRPDLGDVILHLVGYGIIGLVVAMRLLGYLDGR